jgi:hypothetical protein
VEYDTVAAEKLILEDEFPVVETFHRNVFTAVL